MAGSEEKIHLVNPARVARSPWNRTEFNTEKLNELIESVRERGVIQPIIVRPNPGYSIREVVGLDSWQIVNGSGAVVVSGYPENMAKNAVEEWNKAEFEIIAGERR